MTEYPHHTVTSGAVNRGKPTSPFEAVSFNKRTGEYLRTRHTSADQAEKRLLGNARHGQRHYVDYTPRTDARNQPLPPRVVHVS